MDLTFCGKLFHITIPQNSVNAHPMDMLNSSDDLFLKNDIPVNSKMRLIKNELSMIAIDILLYT